MLMKINLFFTNLSSFMLTFKYEKILTYLKKKQKKYLQRINCIFFAYYVKIKKTVYVFN